MDLPDDGSPPKRAYHLLRAEEVPTVLEEAGETWRDLCATAIYLGLRKGELFGLRKQDVNVSDREITIGRSHASDTTKGKRAVVLPIPKLLQPFFEHAAQSAPGPFVFPRADGTRRPENTSMEKVWRRLLVRAGVIVGHRHTCRRCVARKQPATHEFPDAEQRRCPKCNMRMWPSAIPRPMRFHDVRHTTATLLLTAGRARGVVPTLGDWPLTVSISVNDVRLRGLLYAMTLTLRLTVAERRSPAGVVVEVVASAAFIPNLGSGESEVDSTIPSALDADVHAAQ